jgi:hypothetical protein
MDDLRAAETVALARTKGSAAAPNEKRTALVARLQESCGEAVRPRIQRQRVTANLF